MHVLVYGAGSGVDIKISKNFIHSLHFVSNLLHSLQLIFCAFWPAQKFVEFLSMIVFVLNNSYRFTV